MKKKLKVTELKLKSFVTNFGKTKGKTIVGGGPSAVNRCSDYSYCDDNGGGGGYYDCPGSDSCEDHNYQTYPGDAGC